MNYDEKSNDKDKDPKTYEQPSTSSRPLIDPELDIRSEKFNPLKALYTPYPLIPYPDVRLHDNIASFEASVKKRALVQSEHNVKINEKRRHNTHPSTSSSYEKEELTLATRRFLPHQGMVQGKGRKARDSRNLLLRMKSDLDGPTALLKRFQSEKLRVKIYIRNENAINGYVTGIIEAFDKHWNIALKDVQQVWKRKKLHYWSTADCDSGNESVSTDCMQRLKKLRIAIPETKVKSINRKFAECTRFIPQLVVRGEHIAIITLDKLIE